MIGRSATDAEVCRALVRRHARTFALASRLLPQEKRRGAFALYATCRAADDIVDLGSPTQAAGRLDELWRRTQESLRGPSSDPVLRELAWAVNRFQVPVVALQELFEGLRRDLVHVGVDSWSDLEHYCEGVAGCVGEMVCAVFGVRPGADHRRVVRQARTLGVAMQLTNILRDVGEDARRGRCYLPADELAQFGLSREVVLGADMGQHWTAWRSFMAFQIERARRRYDEAIQGVAFLEPDAVAGALACAGGYAEILRAIERREYDTLSARVFAPRFQQIRVAWQSWRRRTPSFAPPVPASANRQSRIELPAR
jgi:phytoene synthase